MADGGGPDSGRTSDDGSPDLASLTRHQAVTESLDCIYELLASARRRYLLYYLRTADETVVELEAAANAIQAYEAAGTDTGDRPPRRTIEIDLHNVHLPRLADAGMCQYDPAQGLIRYEPHPALEELVEHARHKELE
ncbi:DUF7344 domain-containing protein [Halovivax gelatinilyticus]|uniref:DUF7344 domain-containing protein n=1 Tax=Halovivax gelatinilyticus TaxID=2961597 RepID=UPI0020CA8053|nr:hypothetical protein [Halovivax gelatinilyticus]